MAKQLSLFGQPKASNRAAAQSKRRVTMKRPAHKTAQPKTRRSAKKTSAKRKPAARKKPARARRKRTRSSARRSKAKRSTATKGAQRKAAKKPAHKPTKKPAKKRAKKSAQTKTKPTTKRSAKAKTTSTAASQSSKSAGSSAAQSSDRSKPSVQQGSSAAGQSSVQQTASADEDENLTPAQKHAALIFKVLSDHGLAKRFHLEDSQQTKQTLWSYLSFPRYADDMEVYCKWSKAVRPHCFYRIPVRDTSVMSEQKLADQKPRQLNAKQLHAYLSALTVVCLPSGREELLGYYYQQASQHA